MCKASTLVAVRIGADTKTGADLVVNKNMPAEAFVVGDSAHMIERKADYPK